MGTLYIDRKDYHVKLDGKTICFYNNGKKVGMVPLEPLKRVIFVGNLTVDTSVLRKLADMGISAIFLTGRRLRFSGMLHGPFHNNGLLRVMQYEKSRSDFARVYSQEIVLRKIKSQVEFIKELIEIDTKHRFIFTMKLKTMNKILEKLEMGTFDIDSLKGLEGSATSTYFSVYTKLFNKSLNFNSRTRRPPLDPVNAMLSLCYTLVHFEIVRELEVIGLDPIIGFYHQFEYGRESLACDLLELFRLEIDRFVLQLFTTKEMTKEKFSEDKENGGFYLKKENRERFYFIYEDWAKNMRSFFREEVRDLARRINNGKDIIY
jgi:CRISPR-associated protein Cas1